MIPGLNSGAHFILMADKIIETVEDFIEAGRLVQRFWLTATSCGIQLQPQMTPLIFANYHRQSINFTTLKNELRATKKLTDNLTALIDGDNTGKMAFIGRIGYGNIADYRSTRLDINKLLLN